MIDGRIRYYIDGEKSIDHMDESPLPAGRMGLRTWNSNVVWEKIEIGRVNNIQYIEMPDDFNNDEQ